MLGRNVTRNRSFQPLRSSGWLCLAMLLGGFHAVFAQSVQISQLYRAQVAVADNSVTNRNASFKLGLEQVLVRLSGSRTIGDTPEAQAIIEKASKYVLGYRYVEVEEQVEDEEEAESLQIRVEFDGRALERSLHNVGLPVWSSNRPAVMAWLAVEQGRQRFILAEDSESELIPILAAAASERGLSLLLPLMDLEDRRQVKFADVRAGFTENLKPASERYNVQTILIGLLQRERSGKWTVRWSVEQDTGARRWQEYSVPLEVALRSGVDGLADIMASRYAFTAGPDSQLRQYVVAIEQLTSLEQYATLLNNMRDMVFVKHVSPKQIAPDQAEFTVLMRGSLEELQKSLMLSNRLRPIVEPEPAAPRPILMPGSVPVPADNPARTDTVDLRFTLYR